MTPGNPAAIAAAIVDALQQAPDERARMQRTVRRIIEKRADKARHLEALERLFGALGTKSGFSAVTTLKNVLRTR